MFTCSLTLLLTAAQPPPPGCQPQSSLPADPVLVYPATCGCHADAHSSCQDHLTLTQASHLQCPLPANGAIIHPNPEPGAWVSRLFSPLLATPPIRDRVLWIPHPPSPLPALRDVEDSPRVAALGPGDLDPNHGCAGRGLWDLRLVLPLSDPQFSYI